MPNRARMALRGAAAGVILLMITWYLTFHVALVGRADRAILNGFGGLQRPRVDQVTNFIANLCDPQPYVYLAAIPVLIALVRRRPRVAVAVGMIMLAANLTSQLLKPLLAASRTVPVPGFSIDAASWPSGHATAVMSLALCCVLVAPARLRPVVGALMAGFAVAVCYSFLELGWHYPTDVLGGFLVACTWTLLGVGVLYWLEQRRPVRHTLTDASSGERVSLAGALAPVGILILASLVLAGIVALARPHEVLAYSAAHSAFILGAAAIAACGLTIATAATLALRR
ncbi:MAG: phosphatase PAP2 family protein [Solirubrobacteraceae bacterium]